MACWRLFGVLKLSARKEDAKIESSAKNRLKEVYESAVVVIILVWRALTIIFQCDGILGSANGRENLTQREKLCEIHFSGIFWGN